MRSVFAFGDRIMDLPVEPYLIHAITDGAKVECRNKNRNTQTDRNNYEGYE